MVYFAPLVNEALADFRQKRREALKTLATASAPWNGSGKRPLAK
jgi:hypothetical protein